MDQSNSERSINGMTAALQAQNAAASGSETLTTLCRTYLRYHHAVMRFNGKPRSRVTHWCEPQGGVTPGHPGSVLTFCPAFAL